MNWRGDMDKIGISLIGLTVVVVIAYCAAPAGGVPRDEQALAEAYHCGMLDALQEKVRRGRACDEYKSIARKKGVAVPP